MTAQFSWEKISQIGVPKVHRRSVPWKDRDMVIVDGNPMCYRFDRKDNLVVILPGGTEISVEHLRARGHKVIVPATKRTMEYL